MEKYPYEYIPGPECLNKYYQHGSIVSKPVHFVSVLNKLTYKKNNKCMFHFDNFTNGKTGLNTYSGNIKNKSFECDVLLRMVISSLLEKLGMESIRLDFSADFTLKELENRHMGMLSVKGLFITAYDNASLQIHELKVIDLISFFNKPMSDEHSLYKLSIEKLLKNLLKREMLDTNFKFKNSPSYCTVMQSYLDSLVPPKIVPRVNPLFQLALPQQDTNDSFNEFDSQMCTQTQQLVKGTVPLESDRSPASYVAQGVDAMTKTQITTTDNNDPVQSSPLQSDSLDDSTPDLTVQAKRPVEQEKNMVSSKAIGPHKRIKVTDLGAFTNNQPQHRQVPDISSYQLPYDSMNSSQSQLVQQPVFQQLEPVPLDVKPDSISKAVTNKRYRMSDSKILGFTPNQFVHPGIARLEDSKFQIYVYTYDLPLPSEIFIPEYNCFEVVIPNVADFFRQLGISTYPHSVTESLIELSKIIENNRYDITVSKEEFSIGKSKTMCWTFVNVELRSSLPIPKNLIQTENNFPLVNVSDIVPSINSTYYTVIGLAVTVKYTGGKTLVLSFTDFTANLKVSYGYDSFLGSFHERIPENEHVHALVYLNRVESLNQKLQSIIKMGLMECADKGNSNITHRSIIFKFTVKCQLFQGKLNTVILDADPITPTTPVTPEEYKLLKPLRNKVFKRMPSEVTQMYKLTMSRFLPISKNNTSEKPELLQDQKFVDSEDNSNDSTQDSVINIINKMKNGQCFDITENDATLPIEIVGTRNPKTFEILEIKNSLKMDHKDVKVGARIVDIVCSGNSVIIYLTHSSTAGSQCTIEDPFQNLLRIQIWGTQNVTLFYGNSSPDHDNADVSSCIGSVVDFTLIQRALQVNEYVYISVWTPMYATLESLRIHSELKHQQETLKYEELSDYD
ncbi:unnamed protein product [Kluyveromyces dobzhanskii CBS 2104]|uniref:WGS project CCBQ000000000 data, contig 00058 n=1 Tax=Kluyveromyces dobzhanskii CBS 2104 TaxID=1427455 RepID=A0A0A8LB90_9SACH|nr:unnamed protein product [Kluyveromyces dobzhanskii CBS 2104]